MQLSLFLDFFFLMFHWFVCIFFSFPNPQLKLFILKFFFFFSLFWPVLQNDLYNKNSSAVDRNLPASAGDMGSIPGPGRFHMPRGMCATTTEPEL